MSRRFGDDAMDAIAKSSREFPVILYSTGNVAIGAETTLDADDLQNHFDCNIQIEEIRFLFFLNAVATGVPGLSGSFNVANYVTNLAALVRTKLRMGRIDLTNGFVPTWLLGPKLQDAVEVSQGRSIYNAGATTNAAIWHYHKWKLPRPMIVPRGSTLLPSFQYLLPDGTVSLTSAGNSPITVHVALVGRSVGRDIPRVIPVPYATAFIPNIAIKQQQSQDDQLVNKFNVPLHIQRFVGRATGRNNTRLEGWARNIDTERLAGGSNSDSTLTKIRITDSAGYLITPQMTLWDDVFSPARGSMEVRRVLGPRGWYTVQLQDQPSTAWLPMISMIGWREEEMSP